MAALKFDKSLHVGNRLMDREHAILIEHINTLQQVLEGASSRTLVGQILEGLVEYTRTHFYVEEELMQAFKYPSFRIHKNAHDKFKKTMQQLVTQHRSGETNITNELMDFLKDWLVNHIQKIDTQLADFLKGKTLD